MEPFSATSTAIASLAALTVKYLVAALIGDESPGARDALQSIIKDSAGRLAAPIQAHLDRLSISKKVAREIAENPTVFDIAGIAWGEAMSLRHDNDLSRFGKVPAQTVKTVLNPRWFANTLTTVARGNLHQAANVDSAQMDLARLAPQFAAEAFQELGLSSSADGYVESLFKDLLGEVPDRTAALLRSLPENRLQILEDSLSRSQGKMDDIERDIERLHRPLENIDAALRTISARLDGSASKREALQLLRTIAAETVAILDKDVFGRSPDQIQPGDFGLLSLESTYVEPTATQRRRGARGPRLEGTALSLLNDALACDTPLTVLFAPFGYGKSLTVRMLAARLAEAWDGASRFPLLIHAPEILSMNSNQFDTVLQSYMESRFRIDADVARWIMRSIQLVIILDSFDEVVLTSREARAWIGSIRRFTANNFHIAMIASRDHAFEERQLRDDDAQFSLQPFDNSRIDEWLRRTSGVVHDGTLSADIVQKWLGPDLAGTPILLLMAAWDWKSSEGAPSLGRTSLYARFVDRISEGKWKGIQKAHPAIEQGAQVLAERSTQDRTTDIVYRSALARIAWAHLVNEQAYGGSGTGNSVLPRDAVTRILRTEFCAREGVPITEDDIDAVVRSIILSVFVRRAEDDSGLGFAHKSFREFLCSVYLREILDLPYGGEPVYVHPAFRCLAEVHLGSEEIQFTADLANRDLSSERRIAALRFLDDVVDNGGATFFRDRDKRIVVYNEMIVLPSLGGQNSMAAPRNAELLALGIRGQTHILHRRIRRYFRPDRGPSRLWGTKYFALDHHVVPSSICVSYRRESPFLFCFMRRDRLLIDSGVVESGATLPISGYRFTDVEITSQFLACRLPNDAIVFYSDPDAPSVRGSLSEGRLQWNDLCDLYDLAMKLQADGWGMGALDGFMLLKGAEDTMQPGKWSFWPLVPGKEVPVWISPLSSWFLVALQFWRRIGPRSKRIELCETCDDFDRLDMVLLLSLETGSCPGDDALARTGILARLRHIAEVLGLGRILGISAETVTSAAGAASTLGTDPHGGCDD